MVPLDVRRDEIVLVDAFGIDGPNSQTDAPTGNDSELSLGSELGNLFAA